MTPHLLSDVEESTSSTAGSEPAEGGSGRRRRKSRLEASTTRWSEAGRPERCPNPSFDSHAPASAFVEDGALLLASLNCSRAGVRASHALFSVVV